MGPEDRYADYLASGKGADAEHDRLDSIRALLSAEYTWEQPPEELVEGVVREISGSRPGSARSRWWIGAAAVGILIVGILGLFNVLNEPSAQPVAVVSMMGTELAPDASATASLYVTAGGWAIDLRVDSLSPADVGSYYQAWVWSDGDGVPIGSFHLRDGVVPIGLWAGVDLHEYRRISVTLQDEGEGPESSGRVVLVGEATAFEDQG